MSSATSSAVTQYGFYFDQGRCVDCKTCTVGCKVWNNIGPGPSKLLRMMEWEEGTFPNVTLYTLFVPCYHCANPVCIPAANGAMFKEPKYGAVLIDPAQATSGSLRDAWEACPYGSIVFDSDAPNATASKCTMCIDRLTQGLLPVCVSTCMQRALDFGPMDKMVEKYGSNSDLYGLPSSTITTPSIIFKPRIEHQVVILYDANEAIQLMANRDPYPPNYSDASDLTPQPRVVGRSAPNLKPSSTAELMAATQNDEG